MAGVRTGVDVGSLASAVQRPGIDPRYWLRKATVTAIGYDSDNGLFADVSMIPSGDTETCLIGAPYAGNEFGFWLPVDVDDVVLVGIPDGETGNGPVILCRMWSAADKPSSDFGSGTTPVQDAVLRMKPGKKIRMLGSDAGADIELASPDALVKFQAGTQDFIRGNDNKAAFDNFRTAFTAWIELVRAGIVAGGGTLDNSAMTQAISALGTEMQNALSTKVKGE